MKIKKTLSTFLGLGLSIMMGSALPCSNLLLTGGPGSNIVTSARTMDFEFDLQSKFVLVPRNQSWHSDEPAGAKPGVSWINRFGFVGVNIIEMDHVFADGINEQGLSAALLWLHEAKYPAYPAAGGGLSLNDVASYLLGQFATAEEAKYALQNLTIWAPPALELKNHVPTMHLMVMDAQGDSFVVEWTKGRQRIYDAISLKQYQTVLTNSPPYPNQLKNFQRYAKLPCLDRHNGTAGLNPLPGNSNSDARFVRLAKLSTCAQMENGKPPYLLKSIDQALETAFQTIGRVETVKGEGITRPNWPFPNAMYWTQWSLVRVHGGLDANGRSTSKLYVRSSGNQSIRILDLSTIDFNTPPPAKGFATIPIESPVFSKGQTIGFSQP